MKLKSSSFEKNRAEPKSLRLLSGCCCSCCSCCIATLAGASVIAASQFKHAAKEKFPEDLKVHRRAARWGATFFLWGFLPSFIIAVILSVILDSRVERLTRTKENWNMVISLAVFFSILTALFVGVGKRFGVHWVVPLLFCLLFPISFSIEFVAWMFALLGLM